MNFLSRSRKLCQKRANQKSKKLSCKPFSRQARNGFSLLSGCRGDFYLLFFSFLAVWMHFQPAIAKSQSKQVEYVFSLSANHFQPANPESLTNQKSPIRSLVVIVPKLKKSTFFLRKSARNCPPVKVVRSQKSVKTEKSVYVEKRTVPQRFFNTNLSLFPFSTMPANDWGYGLGRPAGGFPVAIATKEMRAQRLPEAH